MHFILNNTDSIVIYKINKQNINTIILIIQSQSIIDIISNTFKLGLFSVDNSFIINDENKYNIANDRISSISTSTNTTENYHNKKDKYDHKYHCIKILL